jgi:hypothetical protein
VPPATSIHNSSRRLATRAGEPGIPRAILAPVVARQARLWRVCLKLAMTTGVTLTLALMLSAPPRTRADDLPRTRETSFFGARTALALQNEAHSPFPGFRARSLEFGHGLSLGGEALAAPLSAWQQPFAPGGGLSLASRSSSTVFTAIDLATLSRTEARWKRKDALEAGVPPRDGESHIGEAVARGVLGFLISRAVGELVTAGQPRKAQLNVRSASDPHGKGVGLRFSASW